MRLSVCILCRNDRTHLRRAIASVAGVAHQVVVADTGSTDGSQAMARSLGALVIERAWDDDFSAARNFATAHATGDWILLLDADEELMSGSVAAVGQAMADPRVLAYLISRLDLQEPIKVATPDGAGEPGVWMQHPRLYRNRPGLRYIGRCHPQFAQPLAAVAARHGLVLADVDIRLRHYGYIHAATTQGKLERGARLMRLELADRPGNPYYEIELGRTLLSLGDNSGLELLRRNARRLWARRAECEPPLPLSALLLEYLLTASEAELGFPLPGPELEAVALRWFPRGAPLLWHIGRRRFQRHDFSGAHAVLATLHRLAQDESFDRRILGDELDLNLGAVCLRLADLDAATAHFQSIPPASPHATAARKNLDSIQQIRRQLADG